MFAYSANSEKSISMSAFLELQERSQMMNKTSEWISKIMVLFLLVGLGSFDSKNIIIPSVMVFVPLIWFYITDITKEEFS